MSHFTVMVFGDDWEEQLAKFHEFECTGDDNEYVQDIDQTEEAREEYAGYTTTRYVDPDGNMHDPYEDRFYRDPTPEEEPKVGMGSGVGHGLYWTSKDWGDGKGYRPKIHFIPDGWKEVEVPDKELRSFAQFVEDYYGRTPVPYGEEPDLAETHKYGYCLLDANGEVTQVINRTNPNAKWDWYQVGGRWCGYFKVKMGGSATVGSPGVFGNSPKEGYADQMRIKDIDIEGMYADAMKEAMETYDKFEEATFGIEIPPTWEYVRKEMFPDNIEEARTWWHDHPWNKALNKAKLSTWGDDHEYYCVNKGGRDAFVENSKCRALIPFAILMDGEWYEKGEMGWWGMVSDEKSQYDWSAKFSEIWDTLDPETLVTIVDCHI